MMVNEEMLDRKLKELVEAIEELRNEIAGGWMTVREVAEYTGIDVRSVTDRIRRGGLRAKKVKARFGRYGWKYLISRREVERVYGAGKSGVGREVWSMRVMESAGGRGGGGRVSAGMSRVREEAAGVSGSGESAGEVG